MRYLSQIGSLLDEIDSTDPQPDDSGKDGDSKAEAGALSDDGQGLSASLGRGFGFLSSAAVAAGTAAAKATAAAVEVADGAKDAVGNLGGVSSKISALLNEEGHESHGSDHAHDDGASDSGARDCEDLKKSSCSGSEKVQIGQNAAIACDSQAAESGQIPVVKERLSGIDTSHGLLSANQEVTASSDAPEPGATPQSSAPPSSRDLAAEGWSLEGAPSELEKSSSARASFSQPSLVDTVGVSQEAATRTAKDAAIVEEQEREEQQQRQEQQQQQQQQQPRSPAPSVGTSVSTSGAATSEEYTRCDEAAGRAEVISSLSVGGVGGDGITSPQPSQNGSTPGAHEAAVSLSPSAGQTPVAVEAADKDSPRQDALDASVPCQAKGTEQVHGFELSARVRGLEADLVAQSKYADEQLAAATKQVEHLQGRIYEVEEDMAKKDEQMRRMAKDLKSSQKTLEETKHALQDVRASEKALEKQLSDAQKEVEVVRRRARNEAAKEKDATLDEVREEMERELQKLLGQKDEQLKALEAKLAAADKTRKEQAREIERQRVEIDKLNDEAADLEQEGAGRVSDHREEVGSLVAEHRKRVNELESRADLEQRQKHELALNLRSVEERARSEIAQLELEKSQFEMQLSTLQSQLQQEQQQRAELSISVGEAQQRIAELEGSGLSAGGAEVGEEARLAMETEMRELREKLRVAEDKLLDSQSVRDMFAKETDMYRTELKVVREERARIEKELIKAQEKAREAHVAQPPLESAQQSVVQSMQKDFESRMERSRDEIQYLRQKCDEKERRCEQLLAERASLAGELRSAGGATAWRAAVDTDTAAATDLEAAGGSGVVGGVPKKASGSAVRSLPLAWPGWLRSSDEPLRLVVRTLSAYPQARIGFFLYVILLHVWVLFILHQSAAQ